MILVFLFSPCSFFFLKKMGKGFLRVSCKQALRWKVIGRWLLELFMGFTPGGKSGRQDKRSEKSVHNVVAPRQCPVPQESLSWVSPSDVLSGGKWDQAFIVPHGPVIRHKPTPREGMWPWEYSSLWQRVMPGERLAGTIPRKYFSAAVNSAGSCRGEPGVPQQAPQ